MDDKRPVRVELDEIGDLLGLHVIHGIGISLIDIVEIEDQQSLNIFGKSGGVVSPAFKPDGTWQASLFSLIQTDVPSLRHQGR